MMQWFGKGKGAAEGNPPAKARPGASFRERLKRTKAPAAMAHVTSPLLASRTPSWRSKFLVACIGLGFCTLVGRAVYIQILDRDFFQAQGESRYARTLELPASRGRVLDRNGLILAYSVPAASIWAIPKDLEADATQKRQLAKLLGMTPADLDKRLADNPNFVWLRRQIDESVAQQVRQIGLKGVHQVKEYKRRYPEGEAVAHVVGFTNVENRGQEGIELAFEGELAGRDGTRRVIKDRLGRIVEDIGESVNPVDGRDIELSIDSKVQFFAYQRLREAVAAHKAKAGSVVVLDAQTGELLALANYPSYVPGNRETRVGERLRNRALTDTFEPGSTMKPFIAALAIESGRFRPETIIDTSPGTLTIGGATIRDTKPHNMLTVAEVIQKSSNVGTVKMAQQMQAREMWGMFSEVGLGQRPDLPFPGVVSGRLRPHQTWRPIEQATMSYGYGLSASLLQLARAYTVFARDGELIPMSLTRQPDGSPPGTRVFKPETARALRKMLHEAAGPEGTAPLAQTIGYSVGGKSGTARKQQGKGYAANKYRSWFVGLAPIDRPRIVVAVMVDEPSNGKFYGGAVAAPVFSEVVQQTLRMMGVTPDIAVQPHIVAEKRQVPGVEESF